ncbi:L-dopachrome tautomerase yellow-f2-like [Anopheles nili]|uniref:L-dopachrome tautomerase yellow-f2-like n=1 Tax=Anopheles nili TaxID=185578 RepID=UPI00237C10F8|nr:L-dopachrome tautomerase yellow-f2-like [Anopheles nili]
MLVQDFFIGTLLYSLLVFGSLATEFEKVFEWKQMSYADLPDSSTGQDGIVFPRIMTEMENETFQAYNNVPMGASVHKNRLFLSIPRRRPGVPATLNVIDLSKVTPGDRSPSLTAYPTYAINELKPNYEPDLNRLVSVYRTRVDACDRLWFVDTGMLEYPDNRRQVQRPQIWVIDLTRDQLVRRFAIPESIVREGVGMASISVDVEPADCERAFAYIPDLAVNAIHVYSLRDDDMWTFNHSSFVHDHQKAKFNVAGQRFQWDDGVFSVAIGQNDTEVGSRLIYYHPMVSTAEFGTFSSVLQSKAIALSGHTDGLFETLGDRGPNTQSTMHLYDRRTGVLFYAEVNRNSIGCWNTAQIFDAGNHAVVHLDNREFIYPSDLTSDSEGTLWVLTNSLPVWIYSRLSEGEFNFRLWRQNPAVAIKGTKCDNLP